MKRVLAVMLTLVVIFALVVHIAPMMAQASAPSLKAVTVTPGRMLPQADRCAVWTNVPTDKPVAFITIDDGYDALPDVTAAADLVQNNDIAVTPFITYYAASSGSYPPSTTDPVKLAHMAFLKRFVPAGRSVQNHSKTHVHLEGMNYLDQYNQLSAGKSWNARTDMFGAPAATLMRPPYGTYNEDTLKACAALGMKVAVLWSLDGSDMIAGDSVRKGDIILLHFTSNLLVELTATLARISAAGLEPAYLTDYIY